jgi:hypothetical protein
MARDSGVRSFGEIDAWGKGQAVGVGLFEATTTFRTSEMAGARTPKSIERISRLLKTL